MWEKYFMYAERLPSICLNEYRYYTLKHINRSHGRLQLLHIIVIFDALKLFLIVLFQLTGSQQWATDWTSTLTFYKSWRSPVATAGSWIKRERKVWETQSLNRKTTSITVFATKLPKCKYDPVSELLTKKGQYRSQHRTISWIGHQDQCRVLEIDDTSQSQYRIRTTNFNVHLCTKYK